MRVIIVTHPIFAPAVCSRSDPDKRSKPTCKTEVARIVTDDLLKKLAHGGPERIVGELTEEDQSILAMILPDLCGELIAYRRLEDAGGLAPRPTHSIFSTLPVALTQLRRAIS